MVSVGETAFQFIIGSPIPMNTMFVATMGSSRRRSSRTWPAISWTARFRANPIAPVAQKLHLSAQPACDEMQSVRRDPSGIATVSMASPSGSWKRNFSVPSDERWRVASARRGIVNVRASASRNGRGSSVIDSKSRAGTVHRRRATCAPR
jgi:hypothetical protein